MLINSLTKERHLREIIAQLKFYESKGITGIDQIEKFGSMNHQTRFGRLESGEAFDNPKDFICAGDCSLYAISAQENTGVNLVGTSMMLKD